MEKRMEVIWLVCISWTLLFTELSRAAIGGNVSYDGRSLIINGRRQILFSGSIHYPRSTPQMWPSLIAKGREGGLDVIQTYVFWNVHEPQQGKYDFTGRYDLVQFIKQIQAQGLYACLRIGPFIESEWNYGGFPVWLHDVPSIVYRSDNEPFKYHMQRFTTKIVSMMLKEQLFASQGGPIILSQIENEYNTVEPAFGTRGTSYVRWAAQMAVSLQTGVPWIMCKQIDAPDPVINTCNGMRCGETFTGPNSPNKPSLWTENWTSFYEVFGEESRLRSPEDIAFHVALFVAKNGSYVNYYMYHGGTNFGRTASSFMRTAYYDQAPLDEYGLLRQPKWGHLKDLHAAIKLCSVPLLWGSPSVLFLGKNQIGYSFTGQPGKCAAFLVNNDTEDVNVVFRNISYELPGKSISISPDCKTIVFNTAKINAQYNARSMIPEQKLSLSANWLQYREPVPIFEDIGFRQNMLLEQLSTTKDESDYLWYTLRFENVSTDFERVLDVTSRAHALHVFVNEVLQGSAHGSHGTQAFTFHNNITLTKGVNSISLLSVTVGLPDSGAYLERRFIGLRKVRIQGTDYSNFSWGYKVGLSGERLRVYTAPGFFTTNWTMLDGSPPQHLTWYKSEFDAPPGDNPVAVNLGSMGKGQVWVNGESVGRYWVSFLTPSTGTNMVCSLKIDDKYNVPRSFLVPSRNQLVLLEEETGNPLQISIDVASVNSICGHVSESHYPPISSWQDRSTAKRRRRSPAVELSCGPNKSISNVLFASFGTPSGSCGSYSYGGCHSWNSRAIVEKACLGKTKCSVSLLDLRVAGDPCPGIMKSLLIDANCA